MALAGLVLAASVTVAAAEPPPEPAGYRMEAYRGPTPATLAGATVLTVTDAERLWRKKEAVFVDVLPRPPKPANLPEGTVWRDKPREHIPGSVWLPNVGYGALSAKMEGYFVRSLEKITQGRKDQALVFYCKAECWMSWNAAKRALSLGYSAVSWFPEGTDGWKKAGLPGKDASPHPE